MLNLNLHSEDGSYSVRAELSDAAGHCHILLEDIAKVDLCGMPTLWPRPHQAQLHTLALPCRHTFHASALLVHFLHQDMRCPLCRKGHTSRLSVHSLPEPSREGFRSFMADLRGHEQQYELEEVRLDSTDMLQHLKVQVVVGNAMVESHRLVLEGAEGGGPSRYSVQRSFVRRLAVLMRSPSWEHVQVRLRHPLFAAPIQSRAVARSELRPDTVFVLHSRPHGEELGRMRLSPAQLELCTEGLLEVGAQAVHTAIAMLLHAPSLTGLPAQA